MKRKKVWHIKPGSISDRIVNDKRYRIVLFASFSLVINLIYSLFNGVLGVITHSWWFVTICAYYAVLSVMRFSAVLYERRSTPESSEYFVMKFSGAMLVIMSVILSGMVYLSLKYDVAIKYHEIIMISIATYTFTKITVSVINAVKVRKTESPLLTTIRNISCADAAVSVLSLQRSMYASFGEGDSDTFVMNVLTGTAVCLFVFLSGISMILKNKKKKQKAERK